MFNSSKLRSGFLQVAFLTSAGCRYGIGAAEPRRGHILSSMQSHQLVTSQLNAFSMAPNHKLLFFKSTWQIGSQLTAVFRLPSTFQTLGRPKQMECSPLAALQASEWVPGRSTLVSWRGCVSWKSSCIQLFTKSALKMGLFFFFSSSTSCFQLRELWQGMTCKPFFYPSLN